MLELLKTVKQTDYVRAMKFVSVAQTLDKSDD